MTSVRVYVGIGSNIDREKNVRGGIKELETRFGELVVSPVYESKSYGFDGDDFYNLVVGFDTTVDIDELARQLREIEFQFGRRRNETRYSPRTLDIDLLLYCDVINDDHDVPREDIEKYAFVLKPLVDIAPGLHHPVIGIRMDELWQAFEPGQQQMQRANFNLGE